MESKKKSDDGQSERIQLLKFLDVPIEKLFEQLRANFSKSEVADDDLLDASILVCSAQQALKNGAVPLPDPPERDETGLPMAIWYPSVK